MRRRYYKEEQRVKYTIRTNQGGGGVKVYADGVYKGVMVNGVLEYYDIEYDHDVTITLQDVGPAPAPYTSSQYADAWISVDEGTPYYEGQFKTVTFRDEDSHQIEALWGYANYYNVPSIQTRGILKPGNTELSINYSVSSRYTGFTKSYSGSWTIYREGNSSSKWGTKLANFSSSGAMMYVNISNNTGARYPSETYSCHCLPSNIGMHICYVDVRVDL